MALFALLACSGPSSSINDADGIPAVVENKGIDLALAGREDFHLLLGRTILRLGKQGSPISLETPGRIEWSSGASGSSGALTYKIETIRGKYNNAEDWDLSLILRDVAFLAPGSSDYANLKSLNVYLVVWELSYQLADVTGMAALAQALRKGIDAKENYVELRMGYREGKLTINDIAIPLR